MRCGIETKVPEREVLSHVNHSKDLSLLANEAEIASNDFDNLGDTSTLADPSVVNDLIENRKNK